MDRARDQLLARTRLAENKDGRAGRRHDRDLLERVAERAAVADDALERVLCGGAAVERDALLGPIVNALHDLAERGPVGDRHRDVARDLINDRKGCAGEGVGLAGANFQRAERQISHHQWHAAEGTDSVLQKGRNHIGEPRELVIVEH